MIIAQRLNNPKKETSGNIKKRGAINIATERCEQTCARTDL
jgi:hypothetical protein